ncbi:MAG: hypothetical protein IJ599_04760 [Alphaproteobacteria bacterium]|nr:hypothetical protein [Alphaproteobacteria bacterium]
MLNKSCQHAGIGKATKTDCEDEGFKIGWVMDIYEKKSAKPELSTAVDRKMWMCVFFID